jgi:hypothetical protein
MVIPPGYADKNTVETGLTCAGAMAIGITRSPT